jgi:adenosine deaminase
MGEFDSFIDRLPKCEMHVHIEGTLEPEMKFALAERNNLTLPYADAEAMKAAYDFNDLPSFLTMYYEGMKVLVTSQDFYDLMFAYLEKAASQNVRYAEIFFDPQGHTSRGVEFSTVITGLRRAQMDAEARFGIRSQLIMCFLRDWSAEYAMATLMEALPYKEWILGIGLDSDEKGHPPLKFEAVFKRAREEGFMLTMHCDVDQENSIEHIRQCVHRIGVNRIDHGVNCLEDEALCQEIKAKGMALTVCPVSNVWITGDSKSKEIKRLLDMGLRVTVNSDDPAYFRGYMTENYKRAQADAGLGRDDLVKLARNAFEGTWLPRARKDQLLAELDAYASGAGVGR